MKAAIMGYGTIGSGVAEMLTTNRDKITKAAGEAIELKYILDLREQIDDAHNDRLLHDFSVIENDDEVELVVETMGGLHPAYDFVKACLLKGKHVVSSNKAIVAAFGTELLRLAAEHECNFFFEAAVGGGIPIIRPLFENYSGEVIQEITGIMNGTTNYILTRMCYSGAGFDECLAEVQRLGYAERDPSADVLGQDTCRKLAILLSLASGKAVNFEDIYTEGITEISDVDFRYAKKLGYRIKLLGSAQLLEDACFAYVAPMMISKKNCLYMVDDVFNGIAIVGNCLGQSMHYGSGAGKLPTASAVMADIINAVKHRHRNVNFGWSDTPAVVEPMGNNAFRYFIRVAGAPGDHLALCNELFMEDGNELELMLLEGMDEFGFVSDLMFESEFQEARAELEAAGGHIRHFVRVGV